MMLLITTIPGDKFLIDCDCFADLDSLNQIGVNPFDVVTVERYCPLVVKHVT